MICGAGNEDLEEVRRLSMIYTLAGATAMDISATPEVVKACMEGIDRAYDFSNSLKKEIKIRPFIMVSVGMRAIIMLEKHSSIPIYVLCAVYA